MRWALALVAVALVAVVVAFVVAVGATRDPVPDTLRACVTAGGAGIMRGEADLGVQPRSDIQARRVRERSRTRVGQDTAVLLEGTNYRLLVLIGRKSPDAAGDLPLQVFRRTSEFALVAKEIDPLKGLLAECVGRSSTT